MFLISVLIIVVMATGALPGVVHTSPTPDAQIQGGPYPDHFPTPTEAYVTFAQLDHKGNYFLFWKNNGTNIQFEAHVKTKGYVGFGISHNGGMVHADVIIGWVTADGTPHFKDRHTIGHYEPIIDKSQDWVLLAAAENDFGTILKFSRPIDTCDDEDDIVIGHGTTKVIYSYHHEDPLHETGLTYHGANRGSKSLLLLDKTPTFKTLPSNAQHYDFVNKQFHVRAQRTFYHCTIYELPKLTSKHHMIMFEPVIQKGNEDIVHHMLVYVCSTNMAKYVGKEYECYEVDNKEIRNCKSVFIAWAVGGEAAYLPDNAGFPLGEHGGPTHVILETHYNNPNIFTGRVDSSGLRIHYTPTLRQHDAATLETGTMVDELHVIPPKYDHFLSRAYCTEDCLRNSLTRMPTQEIRIFAVFQHSHLLGRAIRTKLARNGTELEPIITDEYYDFDYQDTRLLAQERVVKVGDQIVTECDYESREQRSVTFGGLGTEDEMCFSFILYYPRMPMSNCMSLPLYNKYIQSRQQYHAFSSYLGTMDWNNSTVRDVFQADTDNSYYKFICQDYSGANLHVDRLSDPILKKYTPPARTCSNKNV